MTNPLKLSWMECFQISQNPKFPCDVIFVVTCDVTDVEKCPSIFDAHDHLISGANFTAEKYLNSPFVQFSVSFKNFTCDKARL